MGLKTLKKYRNLLIIIITPLIASLIPICIQTKAAKCAFVIILMSTYWITDALPMGITSLLPIVLFPLFGILPSSAVTEGYFKDIIMMFFGGLVVANAIEVTGLHERVALKVLINFSSDPKWLMLGFMITTAFLSLWINNTAATSMMLPVIQAVLEQLVKNDSTYHEKVVNYKSGIYSVSCHIEKNEKPNDLAASKNFTKTQVDSVENISVEIIPDKNNCNEQARKLYSGFLLSCAYSSTIGGIGSLVGTAPNILIKGYFDDKYPKIKLNFLTFMLYALPISLIMVIVSWIWLVYKWIPKKYKFSCKNNDKKCEIKNSMQNIIKQKYINLGPTTWNQKCVAFIFILLIVLWLTRDLHAVPGWGYFFKYKFVSDTTPAILSVFLLFICPKENIFKGNRYSHLINWRELQSLFPWNILLLLGSGLVLANGFKVSGLSDWIGSQFKFFSNTKKEFILVFVILLSATATEFTSNTSIASIFVPLVDSLSKETNIHPIYLLLPLTLSVSLAFMLPVATPNNAIIFSSGHLKMTDMIKTGLLMNIIGFVVIFIGSNTWLGLIFDLKQINNTSINSTLI